MNTPHLPALRPHVLALAAAVAALAGCAPFQFVSTYDPVTDKAVQDLAAKTEAVIADATENGGSFRKHATFYMEAQGMLRAIRMRSEYYGEKNKAEIDTLEDLRASLAGMASSHHIAGNLREEETTGVSSLLRSLIHHQLSKKRSAAVSSTNTSS
jgi:hypothetical protein